MVLIVFLEFGDVLYYKIRNGCCLYSFPLFNKNCKKIKSYHASRYCVLPNSNTKIGQLGPGSLLVLQKLDIDIQGYLFLIADWKER